MFNADNNLLSCFCYCRPSLGFTYVGLHLIACLQNITHYLKHLLISASFTCLACDTEKYNIVICKRNNASYFNLKFIAGMDIGDKGNRVSIRLSNILCKSTCMSSKLGVIKRTFGAAHYCLKLTFTPYRMLCFLQVKFEAQHIYLRRMDLHYPQPRLSAITMTYVIPRYIITVMMADFVWITEVRCGHGEKCIHWRHIRDSF